MPTDPNPASKIAKPLHLDYDIYHDLNRAMFFITQGVATSMAANGGGSPPFERAIG